MKKLIWVSIFFWAGVATVGAQERTLRDLSASERVSQTRSALEELTTLEASALADLEAFESSEADLRRAIADVNTPLPDPPQPLAAVHDVDPNEAKRVTHIQVALGILAEADAVVDDQRQTLSGVPEETLPMEVKRAVDELNARQAAQALVKDFFYGFFILIENQFTIGDIVALGGVTGTVEHITLRITVLRDLKGVVHYIPKGSIGQVSNKTQGWSRVVTEISVPHQEDPDRATGILNEVCRRWHRTIPGHWTSSRSPPSPVWKTSPSVPWTSVS